jgi:hypothetical protein
MTEFNRARLIPVSGIDSAIEAETRAASAFLAVLGIVRPFSKALLDPLGASRAANATVDTYIEVAFDHEGKRVRPDGLVRVSHGTKPPWTALLEVKTGQNQLIADQINMYWEIARVEKFQAVITISNEIAPVRDVHPTPGLRVRSRSPVQVFHFSWSRVLSEAITQMVHRGVDDIEQGWILNELIRYLKHPASGALQFQDMGPAWVQVRDASRAGSLQRRDEGALDVAQRWDQLLQSAALRLGAEIGREVQVVLTSGRKADAGTRTPDLATSLATTGILDGALRVPDAVADIRITADVKAQLLTAALDIEAPRDRGTRGRVSWLVNQLDNAPSRTVIESWPRSARAAVASADISLVRDDRNVLVPDGKEPHRFRVTLRAPMGAGRRAGTKSAGFVDTVLGLLDEFYESVVQNITPWQPPAPRRQPIAASIGSIDEDEAPPAAEAIAAEPERMLGAPQPTPYRP